MTGTIEFKQPIKVVEFDCEGCGKHITRNLYTEEAIRQFSPGYCLRCEIGRRYE